MRDGGEKGYPLDFTGRECPEEWEKRVDPNERNMVHAIIVILLHSVPSASGVHLFLLVAVPTVRLVV